MRHLRRMFAKLTNLFRRGRADHELDREVSAHLALLEDEFQRRGTSLERFVRGRTRSPLPNSSVRRVGYDQPSPQP